MRMTFYDLSFTIWTRIYVGSLIFFQIISIINTLLKHITPVGGENTPLLCKVSYVERSSYCGNILNLICCLDKFIHRPPISKLLMIFSPYNVVQIVCKNMNEWISCVVAILLNEGRFTSAFHSQIAVVKINQLRREF